MWLYIILLILTYIFSIWLFVGITLMRFPKHEMAAKKATQVFLFSLIVLVITGVIAGFMHKDYFFIWFGAIILVNFILETRKVKKIKAQQQYYDQQEKDFNQRIDS